MSQTDDRRDKTLPVTAEVGGEGGSYADPTMQVATFEGDVPTVDQPPPDDIHPEEDIDTAEGIRKFPDEA